MLRGSADGGQPIDARPVQVSAGQRASAVTFGRPAPSSTLVVNVYPGQLAGCHQALVAQSEPVTRIGDADCEASGLRVGLAVPETRQCDAGRGNCPPENIPPAVVHVRLLCPSVACPGLHWHPLPVTAGGRDVP